MTIDNALASVPVRDVDAAADWYGRLLERPPTRPMDEVAEWTFAGGGGLQAYQAPERAGGGSVTLAVTDLEQHAQTLRNLGLDVQVVGNDRVKTAMVQDPDGNSIAFAEAFDPGLIR
jgi:catechol 2,3-dioxygenase-like lactoylglutathione lyase family enzyme